MRCQTGAILLMVAAAREVFLSYASQDAEAAGRICDALRAAGVDVWFDQSELRGGDAWDQAIRSHIKSCALFMPVLSRTTHDRREGYFRLEWKLAIDRSYLMDAGVTFLLPVVIDDTDDEDERVPERFREVQWTRLPGGETPAAFVERVRALLSGEGSPQPARRAAPAVGAHAAPADRRVASWWRLKPALLFAAVALIVVALGLLVSRGVPPARRAADGAAVSAAQSTPAPAASFNPPPHSIAVLPFVNMSGDKDQEYFSDGLTEELLNALAEVEALRVAARTSAFSFKGTDHDIGAIGRKLNVATVLEGSVRRSAHTVRITVQLINTATGFHLWSRTYDRGLGDVLKLQTEIATAVADALKVTLLADIGQKIELGGTRDAAAFDAYLRGAMVLKTARGAKELYVAAAAFSDAIRLDPGYALAFVGRSNAYLLAATSTGTDVAENLDRAQADARRAIDLAPALAEAHVVLAEYFESGSLDFARASDTYGRALSLAPGNAEVLRESGRYTILMKRFDAGVDALRRAVTLDPLNRLSHFFLGQGLYFARRYEDAVAALAQAIAVDPDYTEAYAYRGLSYYAAGDLQSARSSCEARPERWPSQWCLAMVYHKLGRQSDAQAVLARMKASNGESAAYQYAAIHAQWGENERALEWLDMALRLRDPGLEELNIEPLLDPLRKEPRFEAIRRQLKFPPQS